MNDVGVSNYGIFDDAISISNSYSESINNFQSACVECRNVIGDSSTFMGPIADVCLSLFGELDTISSGMVEDNKTINDYLIQTSANYQSGDSKASNLVGSVGTLSSSSGSSSSTTSSAMTGKGQGQAAIFVGDSRTVGMHNVMGETGDVWSGKESMGLNWMKSTGVPNIESQITEGANVVVMMGANDCQYNGKNYVTYMNELSQKADAKGANLYFVSVNPTSGKYDSLNSSIDSFNETVKNGLPSNVKYIDTNSYLRENGYNSQDGLHYDSDTYEKIYSYIKQNM